MQYIIHYNVINYVRTDNKLFPIYSLSPCLDLMGNVTKSTPVIWPLLTFFFHLHISVNQRVLT